MDSVKGQLTLRGIVIGCVGCAIITAASVYTALKMGALPWPIVSRPHLAVLPQGLGTARPASTSERHAHRDERRRMVAGGLAFTIPGIWMLGYADEVAGSRCSS
mgnify:CR=1 FL=1